MATIKDKIHHRILKYEESRLNPPYGREPQTPKELLDSIIEAIRQTLDRSIG